MADFQIYGPLELPSGKKIYFKEPGGGDKLEVLKYNPIGTEDVVSGNELVGMYLSAKCVTQVDGVDVDGDYKHLFKKWKQVDVDYYQAVYRKLFAVDEEAKAKIDEVADFLRTTSVSSAGTM